jgi:hypothetical protein
MPMIAQAVIVPKNSPIKILGYVLVLNRFANRIPQ